MLWAAGAVVGDRPYGDVDNEGLPGVKHPPEDTFTWMDPPQPQRRAGGRAKVRAHLPELRRHPKRWARLLTYRSMNGAGTARQVLQGFEEFDDVEFTARRSPDGGSVLFGRWTGEIST